MTEYTETKIFCLNRDNIGLKKLTSFHTYHTRLSHTLHISHISHKVSHTLADISHKVSHILTDTNWHKCCVTIDGKRYRGYNHPFWNKPCNDVQHNN